MTDEPSRDESYEKLRHFEPKNSEDVRKFAEENPNLPETVIVNLLFKVWGVKLEDRKL